MQELVIKKLSDRGVSIESLSTIAFDIQKQYQPLTIKECEEAVLAVLSKREVIYTILTGIALDEAAENSILEADINTLIKNDTGLYGLDEILALSIVNINGSIALTNFGYLDKTKPGIIGIIDKEGKATNKCHTFLDDILCAIIASAASRVAHNKTEI